MDTIPINVLCTMLLFTASFLFFFLAIQQPVGPKRFILGSLQLLSIVILFWTDSMGLLASFPMVAPFLVGLSVHSASIVFCGKKDVDLPSLRISEQLTTTFRLLTDIRGVGHRTKDFTQGCCNRFIFGALQLLHVLLFNLIDWFILAQLPTLLLPDGMSLTDLAPPHQGLIPSSGHDIAVRTLMTVNWIWGTYYGLSVPHIILSIVSVSILNLDRPSEWPPLFGSILGATSVHKFWGVFWQRLHVRPFEAFISTQQKPKCVRAFLMFLMSAACHAMADFALHRENTAISHLWFFMHNFALCTAEIMVLRALRNTAFLQHNVTRMAMRGLGYVWTFVFFLCVTPRWQYPLILSAVTRGMRTDSAAA